MASSLVPSFVIWMSATRFAIRNGEGSSDYAIPMDCGGVDGQDDDDARRTIG